MGPDFEWHWEVARYSSFLPDPTAQIFHDALRRAHEQRHAEFRAAFAAIGNMLRRFGRLLTRRAWRVAL